MGKYKGEIVWNRNLLFSNSKERVEVLFSSILRLFGLFRFLLLDVCERLFVCLVLATNVFSLRQSGQCATVDCTSVHEPSFSFDTSEKDVFYSN